MVPDKTYSLWWVEVEWEGERVFTFATGSGDGSWTCHELMRHYPADQVCFIAPIESPEGVEWP